MLKTRTRRNRQGGTQGTRSLDHRDGWIGLEGIAIGGPVGLTP